MRSFLTTIVLVLCVNFAVTSDVCDIQNNDAATDACNMKKAFAGSQVYPQLLNSFSPQGALYVHYPQVIVGGAQQLSPTRVAQKPDLWMSFIRGPLSAPGAQMLAKKYAVMCIDFQPQTRVAKPIWFQSGMTVNRSTGGMSSSIAPTIPYQAPNPQRGTGTHEYVFLIFEDTNAGLWATLQQKLHLRAGLNGGSFDINAFRAQAAAHNLVAGSCEYLLF
ncbi:hypothetical protein VP01_1685g5 [Puccinia sorghi]|uniref:Phosphatidylethanolamine-binding protein n=1 Tax=Puccinia sorghi TaxID=27349 RepID=A0A0L6VFU7_9BASI|nr:hypothetical protein VP01_1685g5 [Puccinia sorghi]